MDALPLFLQLQIIRIPLDGSIETDEQLATAIQHADGQDGPTFSKLPV